MVTLLHAGCNHIFAEKFTWCWSLHTSSRSDSSYTLRVLHLGRLLLSKIRLSKWQTSCWHGSRHRLHHSWLLTNAILQGHSNSRGRSLLINLHLLQWWLIQGYALSLPLSLDLLELFVLSSAKWTPFFTNLHLLKLLDGLLLTLVLLFKLLDPFQKFLVLTIKIICLLYVLSIVLLKMLGRLENLLSLNMIPL